MPIFNSNNKRVILELVTSDGQDQNTDQETNDYTAASAQDNTSGGDTAETTDYTQTSTDTPADASAPAGNPGDPGTTDTGGDVGGGDETTDYTAEPTGEEGGDMPADDGTGEASGEEETSIGEEKTPDEIKQLEDELFASLTPEQLAIKNLELKNLYIDLYDVVEGLIVRINDLPKNAKFISVVEFISDNLSELKAILIDYINGGTYNALSYTENSINYNKFVAVLHGINKMIQEIKIDETEEFSA